MPVPQRIVQVCLFIVAAIALIGGTVQMVLGQPDTTPRLDNVHRFMAGVYLSTGIISFWAARTIRQQGTLVYLLALGVFFAGIGRLISISQVGLPEPHALCQVVLLVGGLTEEATELTNAVDVGPSGSEAKEDERFGRGC